MKLTCDLCGGALQMDKDGQSAVCTQCGIAYPMERLREKLGAQPAGAASTQAETARVLRILRKRTTVLFKAVVLLDGEVCAELGKPGSVTEIPVAPGAHEISFRVATAAGVTEMDALRFQVGSRDLRGVFALKRGAFRAGFTFELQED